MKFKLTRAAAACFLLAMTLAVGTAAWAEPFELETKITTSDASRRVLFGRSVGISGNAAIVGATTSEAGQWSGSAYLFDVTNGDQLFKLTASDAAAWDAFGNAVGISGNTAIVSAYGNDDAGDFTGSAYLFDVTTGRELLKPGLFTPPVTPREAVQLGGTSFEEPRVGALAYTGVGGEIGFTRKIDANGDGTFGDADTGGFYGVIDDSPKDNSVNENPIIVSNPLFSDGDQGYAAVGSNGGARQQPVQQLTFDTVRWDSDQVSDVKVSLDVYTAERGYEPDDILRIALEVSGENGSDVLSVLNATGTEIENGLARLSEGDWRTVSLGIGDEYDSAKLIITSSTNASSLGEGFIFDNILFSGFSLLLSSDLTGNGFVDFEDLTVLLANWNKDVTAADGNLVEPLTTVVNFEDLTVLLADWTGPGGAASPQAALGSEAVPEPSTLVLALVVALVGLPAVPQTATRSRHLSLWERSRSQPRERVLQ